MADNKSSELSFELTDAHIGKRIDQVLADLLSDYSRSRIQSWLKSGFIQVNGRVPKAKEKVCGGEVIQVRLEQALQDQSSALWEAQSIALDIVYEDDFLIVINKPAGLVVHPGAGNHDGTLVNALLNHAPELSKLPRAGVIHRLDKNTTGILVVARNLAAHNSLSKQLQARSFHREYRALVSGLMTAGGTIDAAIGRHPVQRTKMAVLENSKGAKQAITHYRVEQKFRAHTLIRVKLETGRTHQIRVHMSHIKYPVLGDPVYAGRLRMPPNASNALLEAVRRFKRQALHAKTLGFIHPKTQEYVEWSVDLPSDMRDMIAVLENDLRSHVDD